MVKSRRFWSSSRVLQLRCKLYAAAHHHHVDVARWPFEEEVAHVSAHHVALKAEPVGRVGYGVEYVLVERLGQFFVCKYLHLWVYCV